MLFRSQSGKRLNQKEKFHGQFELRIHGIFQKQKQQDEYNIVSSGVQDLPNKLLSSVPRRASGSEGSRAHFKEI
jgi:hypothetical protein